MEKLGQMLKQAMYSTYELLFTLWNKVNDVIDSINGLTLEIDDKISKSEATPYTNEEVSFLITSHSNKLSDNAISPDDFEGTDEQKLQQAIDKAISDKVGIRLARMFTVVNPLKINKLITNDEPVNFIGVGGGIIKNTSSWLFDTDSIGISVNNIKFTNVKFQSIAGNGLKILNGNKFYRCVFSNCQFINVDNLIYSDDYIQSIYFLNGNIVKGGNGWFVDTNNSYDLNFSNNIIEQRDSFMRHRHTTADPSANTLRICNNLIEGLTGKAIEMGACFGVTIKGNYMELNQGGYVDISKSTSYHKGIEISGNTFQLTADQLAASHFPIKWGKAYGSVKGGNNVSNGNLHDVSLLSPTPIDMSGDICYNGKLYTDYQSEEVVGRAPLGFATYQKGATSYYAFFNEYIGVDPYQLSWGGSLSQDINGSLAPLMWRNGGTNPQTNPADYGNTTWAKGSKVFNKNPSVLGSAGSQYIIEGWKCITGGQPGTWVECRTNTGS